MAHVYNDQSLLLHLVIDKIGIPGGWEYANAGNIGLASKSRISGQQQTCDANLRHNGSGRSRTMLCNVLVDIGDVGVGLRRKTKPHRPHFFQRAAMSSSLTYSPRSASARP